MLLHEKMDLNRSFQKIVELNIPTMAETPLREMGDKFILITVISKWFQVFLCLDNKALLIFIFHKMSSSYIAIRFNGLVIRSLSSLLDQRQFPVSLLLLLPRSSNGLSTLHNKGSSALQVLQAAVKFLAHGCWVWPDLFS